MGLNELDNIYNQIILEHSRDPMNQQKLEHADITSEGVNPFCGDEINLQIRINGKQQVQHIGLQGIGCAINKATGSMLTNLIKGKTLDEIKMLSQTFNSMMYGHNSSKADLAKLADLAVLSDVRKSPIRIKCTLLAWDTLENGIESYVLSKHRQEIGRK